jgi:hypothetical protein
MKWSRTGTTARSGRSSATGPTLGDWADARRRLELGEALPRDLAARLVGHDARTAVRVARALGASPSAVLAEVVLQDLAHRLVAPAAQKLAQVLDVPVKAVGAAPEP